MNYVRRELWDQSISNFEQLLHFVLLNSYIEIDGQVVKKIGLWSSPVVVIAFVCPWVRHLNLIACLFPGL